MAAKFEIVDDRLHVTIEGVDRVLSLRTHIDVPLSHVRGARVDPEAAHEIFRSVKVAGARIPGVVTAGSFYGTGGDGWTFVDVHDPTRVVVVDLDHEHYRSLILQVDDPPGAVAVITSALQRVGGADGSGTNPG